MSYFLLQNLSYRVNFWKKKYLKTILEDQKKRYVNQQANEINMHDVNQFGFSTHNERKLSKDYYKFCYVDI